MGSVRHAPHQKCLNAIRSRKEFGAPIEAGHHFPLRRHLHPPEETCSHLGAGRPLRHRHPIPESLQSHPEVLGRVPRKRRDSRSVVPLVVVPGVVCPNDDGNPLGGPHRQLPVDTFKPVGLRLNGSVVGHHEGVAHGPVPRHRPVEPQAEVAGRNDVLKVQDGLFEAAVAPHVLHNPESGRRRNAHCGAVCSTVRPRERQVLHNGPPARALIRLQPGPPRKFLRERVVGRQIEAAIPKAVQSLLCTGRGAVRSRQVVEIVQVHPSGKINRLPDRRCGGGPQTEEDDENPPTGRHGEREIGIDRQRTPIRRWPPPRSVVPVPRIPFFFGTGCPLFRIGIDNLVT